jgi:hypothetical protein
MCQSIIITNLCGHNNLSPWYIACSARMDNNSGFTKHTNEDATACKNWKQGQWLTTFRCFHCSEKDWLMWKDRRDWKDAEEKENRARAATQWREYEVEQTKLERDRRRLAGDFEELEPDALEAGQKVGAWDVSRL